MEKNQIKHKDQWYYYTLFAGLYTLLVVAWIYFGHMSRNKYIGAFNLVPNVRTQFSYIGFQSQFLSYFTIQSNMIVGFWFIYATINRHQTDKFWLKQNTILAITSYITVTCLTYMIFIFPSKFNKMDSNTYFESMSQHLVVPILMIFYTMFNFKNTMINPKQYIKKHLFKNLIYPTVYFLIVMYRYLLWTLEGYGPEVSFPYLQPSFFNLIPAPMNVIVFILTFISLNMALFVGSNLIYVYFSNLTNKKRLKKQS